MRMTLAQAAEAVGVGKTTLRRMIHNGRISAHRDDQGAFMLDPAELSRVFPDAPLGAPGGGETAHRGAGVEEVARRELELLREMVERERMTNADLRERLDRADEERRRLLALLEHIGAPAARQEAPQSAPEASRPTLLDKLFGRR